MKESRELIFYLPPFLREYREFQVVTDVESKLVNQCWDSIINAYEQAFIMTADSEGLARWEKIYGIVTDYSKPLEIRRYELLNRMQQQRKYNNLYNLNFMVTNSMNNFVGFVKDELDLVNNTYSVYIQRRLADTGSKLIGALQNSLDEFMPAIFINDVHLLNNNYQYLKNVTATFGGCGYLKQYTYKQAQEENLGLD